MLNLSDANSSGNVNESNNKFPTIGLKSLLQNSDLLDLLLRPIKSKPEDQTNANNNQNIIKNDEPQKSTNINHHHLNTNELVTDSESAPTINDLENLPKSLFDDWDNTEEYLESKLKEKSSDIDNSSKIYGNTFFGPNLWEKNNLFQSEKLGVKFEILDFDDFLTENNLNESDVEFLDRLQKTEAAINSSINETSPSSSSSSNVQQQSTTSSSSSIAIQSTTSTNINHQLNNNIGKKMSVTIPPSRTPSTTEAQTNGNYAEKNMIKINNLSNPTSPSSIASLPNSSSSSISPISSVNSHNNSSASPNNRSSNKHTISIEDTFNLNTTSIMPSKSTVVSAAKKTARQSNESFDWTVESNDLSIDSMSDDFDDFDSRYSMDSDMKSLDSNKKSKKQFVPNELKDDKYWARRRKNNLAAKRSRDARRMKENQIAVRATYLERENDTLKKQLEDFKRETKILKLKLARYESMNIDLTKQ